MMQSEKTKLCVIFRVFAYSLIEIYKHLRSRIVRDIRIYEHKSIVLIREPLYC